MPIGSGMHQDGNLPPDDGQGGAGTRVPLPWGDPTTKAAAERALEVRLRREWKGVTVRDLIADLGLDEQLPGRVQTALDHIRRGDLAAAERALPGHFGALLQGPGHRSHFGRRAWVWGIVVTALAAAAVSATMTLL
ncbi:MAG: hypothetical protein ABL997_03290 [Planctomycetota bacterium]